MPASSSENDDTAAVDDGNAAAVEEKEEEEEDKEDKPADSVPAEAEEPTAAATATTTTTSPSPTADTEKPSSIATAQPDVSLHNLVDNALVLTSEKRRGVYECDYCHFDISQLPRIRCAVCPDFDLCLDCFATTDHSAALSKMQVIAAAAAAASSSSNTPSILSQSGVSSLMATATTVAAVNHDETHGYRVCDSTRYPLFPPMIVKNNNNSNKGGEEKATDTAAASQGSMSSSDRAAPASDTSTTAMMEVEEDSNEERESGSDTAKPASSTNSIKLPSSSTSDQAQDSSNNSNMLVSSIINDPKIYWTIEEDLRLIEGIRVHGLGNWVDIADAVAGQGSIGKTPKKCMERYLDGFLGRYGCILPPMALEVEDNNNNNNNNNNNETTTTTDESVPMEQQDGSAVATDETEEKRVSKRRSVYMRSSSGMSTSSGSFAQSNKKRFKAVPTESMMEQFQELWPDPYLPPDVTLGQEVGRDQAYKAEQQFVKTMASLETVEEAERLRSEWQDKVGKPGWPTVLPMRLEDIPTLPGSEIAGFMPRRGDFDIEWENDAEQVVADMEFVPGEPVADKELKLKVLAIYNSKLDEREKRKQYILSRGLYNYRKNQLEEQKLPRDERDLIHRMRLFERFHTPEEHKVFIADLLKAKRLRKEIAKLQTYRRLGVRTLAEAEQYEVYKSRRAFHKTAFRQKEAEAAKSSDDKVNDTEARATSRSSDDAASSSLWKQYRTNQRKGRANEKGDSGDEQLQEEGKPTDTEAVTKNESADVEKKDDPMEIDAEKEDAPVKEGQDGEEEAKAADTETTADAPAATDDSDKEAKESPAALDAQSAEANIDKLSTMPGFQLLLAGEADLCRKLELTPMQYQEIKRALLLECLSQGLLDRETASSSKRALVNIDVQKRGQVVDFMVTAGWISLKRAEDVLVASLSEPASQSMDVEVL
jgi:hypothetical protein